MLSPCAKTTGFSSYTCRWSLSSKHLLKLRLSGTLLSLSDCSYSKYGTIKMNLRRVSHTDSIQKTGEMHLIQRDRLDDLTLTWAVENSLVLVTAHSSGCLTVDKEAIHRGQEWRGTCFLPRIKRLHLNMERYLLLGFNIMGGHDLFTVCEFLLEILPICWREMSDCYRKCGHRDASAFV